MKDSQGRRIYSANVRNQDRAKRRVGSGKIPPCMNAPFINKRSSYREGRPCRTTYRCSTSLRICMVKGGDIRIIIFPYARRSSRMDRRDHCYRVKFCRTISFDLMLLMRTSNHRRTNSTRPNLMGPKRISKVGRYTHPTRSYRCSKSYHVRSRHTFPTRPRGNRRDSLNCNRYKNRPVTYSTPCIGRVLRCKGFFLIRCFLKGVGGNERRRNKGRRTRRSIYGYPTMK